MNDIATKRAIATHAIPGLLLTDLKFEVPLDYSNRSRKLEIFVREVVAAGKEKLDLPSLVFFQGGPGSGSPRPLTHSGWIKRMTQEFRVLLLDQRGTGLSTAVTAQSLSRLSPKEQAEYLRHFRTDNIVRDAETIRRALIGERKWTILGQSYGGFCSLRYLSASPEGLEASLITGGIPSLTRPADDVYRATYSIALDKNRRYYERYPGDVERVREIVRHLASHDVRLPNGSRLTVERFRQLGFHFGMSDGFETVHYLLEEAFIGVAGGGREMNATFLAHIDTALSAFDVSPIFSMLQEACYTQGTASRWSAERVRAEYPQFDSAAEGVFQFTGEMVYRWMFDEDPGLKPLKEAANLLAEDASWPQLYDIERLKRNTVPVAAAVYYDDMYVPRQFSEETARIVPHMKLWITNQYEHNALRADGEAVVGRLLEMARGQA
jgi:pimeloyl-ACP methyl ester carboxylesterase